MFSFAIPDQDVHLDIVCDLVDFVKKKYQVRRDR